MAAPLLHVDRLARRYTRGFLKPQVTFSLEADFTIDAPCVVGVMGPNGSGKTTLVHVASTYLWPTSGTVEVLGETIGRVDARELRRRVGYAGAGLEAAIDPNLTALDVVVTARHAALGPWWPTYSDADRARAGGHGALEGRHQRQGGSPQAGEGSRRSLTVVHGDDGQ